MDHDILLDQGTRQDTLKLYCLHLKSFWNYRHIRTEITHGGSRPWAKGGERGVGFVLPTGI